MKIDIKQSRVKARQLLFLIDQRPFKAALQDTRGQLAQARAAAWKAEKDVARSWPSSLCTGPWAAAGQSLPSKPFLP